MECTGLSQPSAHCLTCEHPAYARHIVLAFRRTDVEEAIRTGLAARVGVRSCLVLQHVGCRAPDRPTGKGHVSLAGAGNSVAAGVRWLP